MNLSNFSAIIRDEKINEADKLTAFNEFYSYYLSLVKLVMKNKTFTDKQLSHDIFRRNWNENPSETVFIKYLFSSFKTLERIKTGIDTNTASKYKVTGRTISINDFADFLFIFSYDVFGIVRYAEENYNNKKLNYSMGGRSDLSVREIFENANIILHIKSFGADSIHYRDFFSYTTFTIRLMIEVAGKRILGYHTITDDKEDRIRGVKTQIAWDFIKQDQLSNKRIQLPIEVDTILKVEKWTNFFIHTGYVQPIFLVENALLFLEKLVFPCNNTKNHQGQIRHDGTTKISNYNAVKSDFENFVQSKIKNSQKCIINWKDEKHVDSTILSL